MANTPAPGAKVLDADQLTSDMMIEILAGALRSMTPLSNLAQFFSDADAMLNTNITTVGAGSLTAAALLGGVITRSGSTAAYTDTTVTAAAILAAMGADTPVGTSKLVWIKNTVAFPQTIAAGAGVTLAGQTIIPPNSVGLFLLTLDDDDAAAVTLRGISVGPMTTSPLLAATALTTVGAGTITAAGIAGGVTTRGGAQSGSAFTDTTDTAVNLIAALPNANIGQSFLWLYRNNTDAQATLAGGVGVTVSGITIVPKNSWALFLVTYSAAATATVVGIGAGPGVSLPASKFTTGTGATLAAGDITGADVVNYINTGNNATITTRTAAEMFGDIPNCQIGYEYQLFFRNTHATSATITAGSNVTLTGTMTVAQNETRNLNVRFTSATACTITSMGVAAGA